MISQLYTAPTIVCKVAYSGSQEKTIGYVSNLTYSVSQGQKMIFTVDNPFPAEIAQGASQSYVRGTMDIYWPKGTTPESLGLVPFRTDSGGQMYMAASKYMSIRLYDRATQGRILSLDHIKFGTYTIVITARNVVKVNLQFEGFFVTPNLS